jgi:hypothetical protein
MVTSNHEVYPFLKTKMKGGSDATFAQSFFDGGKKRFRSFKSPVQPKKRSTKD